jgi:acetyl esterase
MLRTIGLLFATFVAMSTVQAAAAEPKPVAPGLHSDIEFAKPDGVSLTLDAFVPEGDGPFPTVIFVHGGGFMNGDKQSYIKPLFEPVGKAGFTWFTINYRLAPKHRWPACGDDVATAVRWVKAHAAEYRVDPQRIALVGESAGGHLVSWVGGSKEEALRVAAVVPIYAPHDLEWRVKHKKELGGPMKALLDITEMNEESFKKLRDASPSSRVHKGMPPYLLIHGDNDAQVPYEQSPMFQKQMLEVGNVCDLITVKGGEHGMGKWKSLGSDYQEQMIAWLKKVMK